jgi:hypothetical protein
MQMKNGFRKPALHYIMQHTEHVASGQAILSAMLTCSRPAGHVTIAHVSAQHDVAHDAEPGKHWAAGTAVVFVGQNG